jgi:hypothetical protein
VWFLRKELGHHRDLGAVVVPVDSPFLVDFVQFHLADIHRFQPTFEMPTNDGFCVLLLRDGLPAGAVIGRTVDDTLHVELDYVLRAYRDSRLGAWLYGRGSAVFREHGITCVSSQPGNEVHRSYLERMGFERRDDRFELRL